MKLVLFDFCDTLVNFQTADPFVEYVKKEYGRGIVYDKFWSVQCVYKFLEKHWKLRKKINLYQIKGLNEDQIRKSAEDYYNTLIRPNSFVYMKNLIKEYKEKEYVVYLISGGYEEYIKFYADELGVDGVIANSFKYKNKKGRKIFTGKIIGKECMDEEKVNRLNRIFKKDEVDFSISYSDSLSDLPLFRWTDKAVLVSKSKERKCAKENGLEQIVLADYETKDVLFEH